MRPYLGVSLCVSSCSAGIWKANHLDVKMLSTHTPSHSLFFFILSLNRLCFRSCYDRVWCFSLIQEFTHFLRRLKSRLAPKSPLSLTRTGWYNDITLISWSFVTQDIFLMNMEDLVRHIKWIISLETVGYYYLHIAEILHVVFFFFLNCKMFTLSHFNSHSHLLTFFLSIKWFFFSLLCFFKYEEWSELRLYKSIYWWPFLFKSSNMIHKNLPEGTATAENFSRLPLSEPPVV